MLYVKCVDLCLGVTFALTSLGIALCVVVMEGGGQAAQRGRVFFLEEACKRKVSLYNELD